MQGALPAHAPPPPPAAQPLTVTGSPEAADPLFLEAGWGEVGGRGKAGREVLSPFPQGDRPSPSPVTAFGL